MGNVANIANVANACGLVGRVQHDMQTLDCALSVSRPTAREQPVRRVQVCLWNDSWCAALTCDGLGVIWRDIKTKCRRFSRYYRTITLSALWYILYVNAAPHVKGEQGLRAFDSGVLRDILEMRGATKQDDGKTCIMTSCIICTLHKMLFGWSNQGKLGGWNMWHEWGRREMHKWLWYGEMKKRDTLA
jgi:hypothetical protein